MMQFAYPLLFALLLLPFIIRKILPELKGMHGDALKIPFIGDLEKISIKSGSLWSLSADNSDGWSRYFWMLYIVWFLLVCSVARPQILGEPIRMKGESRDIMLVLDISTSMLAQDFAIGNTRVNRLTAVKKTASDFVKKRVNDRIGLILFGTRAYLQVPLTYDKNAVDETLWSMQAGMAGDSTSIGDALGLALKNLQNDTELKNKVIILLTDGENNDGNISLAQALKLSTDQEIKTYTIGVGSQNLFLNSLFGQVHGIDEQALNAIAQATKGQYFRAGSTKALQQVYDLIDNLETSQHQDRMIRETKELFYIPLSAALLFALLLAYVLRRAE